MPRRSFTKVEEIINKFLKNNTDIKRITNGQRELVHRFFELWLRNRNIESNKKIFIPQTEMQQLGRSKYQIIRDVCVELKHYSNRKEKICKLIIGWKYAFDCMCFDLLKVIVNMSIRTNCSNSIKKDMNRSNNHYSMSIRTPGYNTSEYTQTDKSNRWYHSLQNLDSEQKKIVYAGDIDFDIVNCFPNLFDKFIIGDYLEFYAIYGDMPPQDYIDMINEPELFIQKLISANLSIFRNNKRIHIDTRKKAKQMRSRLFCAPLDKKLRKTGCEWYDNLADWIRYQLIEAGVNDPHIYFTEIEQQIIEKAFDVVGRDNVKLRMHDGFISKDMDNKEEMLEKLYKETKLKWSVKEIK